MQTVSGRFKIFNVESSDPIAEESLSDSGQHAIILPNSAGYLTPN
jgi:hypothetical protein